MLRVKIEIVPFGIESLKRDIFTGNVVNDGTGNNNIGNYEYDFVRADSVTAESISGNLNGFDRDRGALSLLKNILNQHPEI